jgi:hypothetical protein
MSVEKSSRGVVELQPTEQHKEQINIIMVCLYSLVQHQKCCMIPLAIFQTVLLLLHVLQINRHLQAANAYAEQQDSNGLSAGLLRLVPQATPGAASMSQQQQHLAQPAGSQPQQLPQQDAGVSSVPAPPPQQQQQQGGDGAGQPGAAADNASAPAAASGCGGPASIRRRITPSAVQDAQRQQQQAAGVADGAPVDGVTGRAPLQENRTQQQVVLTNGQQHTPAPADKAAARSSSIAAEAAADAPGE